MSRRLLLGLIVGIGLAALPIGVRADGGSDTTANNTGAAAAKATKTIVIHPTVIFQPATQPGADATTQPAGNVPATQPNVAIGNTSFTVTTAIPAQVGPGQMKVLHSTMTITVNGGNIVVHQGNGNPPATQPSGDDNTPATQPANNGG